MTAIKDVSEIRAYQRALKLYAEVVDFVYLIPFEFRKEKMQLFNSSGAIAPLISEGYAKKRNAVELHRFWEMALAETDEMITHMTMVKSIIKHCPRIKEEKCNYFIEEYTILAKELNKLMQNWNKYSK